MRRIVRDAAATAMIPTGCVTRRTRDSILIASDSIMRLKFPFSGCQRLLFYVELFNVPLIAVNGPQPDENSCADRNGRMWEEVADIPRTHTG